MNAYLAKLNVSVTIAYCAGIIAVLAYCILAQPDTSSAVGLIAAAALSPIFILKTEYGLYALLIVRPLIDAFAGYAIISTPQVVINLNAVVAILVILWLAFTFARDNVRASWVPGLGWLIAFLVWGLVSLVNTADAFVTISEWLRMGSVVAIFIISCHVAKQRAHALTRLIPVLGIAMVIPLVVALVQWLTLGGLSFGTLTNRVYGTFGHPNVLAFYLVCTVSVLMVTQLATPLKQRSLLYPWLIAAGLLGLLFTYTRGAWLGFLIIQLIVGLKYHRKMVTVLAGAVIVLFIFWQTMNAVMISTFNFSLNDISLIQRFTTRDEEADSIDWRLGVLQTMAPRTLEQPITGFGLGNFVTLRKQSVELGLYDDPEAHNDYLRLAIEMGFVGLALYIGFWISVLGVVWKNFNKAKAGSWQQRYSLLAIAMILALLEMSVGDNLLQGTAVIWTYLAVIGTIAIETMPKKQPHF